MENSVEDSPLTEFTESSNSLDSKTNNVVVNLNNFPDFLNLINVFSGTDPTYQVSDFIAKVQEIAEVANWSVGQILLAAKLRLVGDAATYANQSHELKTAVTLPYLKEILLKRFPAVENNSAFLELATAIQQRDESPRQFLLRISNLAHACFKDDKVICDKILLNQALAGLNSQVRRFIMVSNPSTFEEVWQLAIREEQCASYDVTHAKINEACTIAEHSFKQDPLHSVVQSSLLETDHKIKALADQVQVLTRLVEKVTVADRAEQNFPPI